jgi:hypothetical protein
MRWRGGEEGVLGWRGGGEGGKSDCGAQSSKFRGQKMRHQI